MIEAVFDTNVFLQAATSKDGPAGECWSLAEAKFVRIYTCEAILAELGDILSRSKVRRQFPKLNDENVDGLLTTFRTFCDVVEEPEKRYELTRDKDDSKFVDLALATGAQFIVSIDKDLLDLSKDLEFSTKFPEFKIVSPVGFLIAVRAA